MRLGVFLVRGSPPNLLCSSKLAFAYLFELHIIAGSHTKAEVRETWKHGVGVTSIVHVPSISYN